MSQKEISERKSVGEVTESTSLAVRSMRTWLRSNNSLFSLQSDVTDGPIPQEAPAGDASANGDVPVTTVSFSDGQVGQIYTVPDSNNPVAEVDSTPDVGLAQFMSRPVVIDSMSWTTADTIGPKQTITPWQLFFANTAVSRKLNNFAFIRGKLHVKFVINATPFQYGLMRVSYRPLNNLVQAKTASSGDSTYIGRLIQRSQQPGVYLEPSCNAGGELELPFFYHKNWLDLTSNTDCTNMGELSYDVFAALAVALSGASTSVTVRTFAWMTDVELMGPTSKLVLQSDEYGDKPVSGRASAIASVASQLVNVPIIGPFARATTIGASAVGAIASIFGFTNVPNINNVEPVYCMSAPQLATSEISVPYQKLVLDPKTELSIDPTLFGLKGEDELALSYLKKKESLYGRTSWSTTDALNTKLMNVQVTPTLSSNQTINNASAVQVGWMVFHTPLSYIAQLFKHWRGSLRFRFKVVCTKYHKGRLKFSYDPVGDISTAVTQTNEVYTHILDLGETDEITIEVPYHQALAWLAVNQGPNDNWNLGNSLTPDSTSFNGMISVSVFNVLEAPNTPSSISILGYVSGGDDFEFANPQGWISNGSTLPVPSFFALQSEVEPAVVVLGDRPKPHPDRYSQNFGESVMSLRKLMHRSQIADTVLCPAGTASATNLYRKSYFRIPYCPGFTPETMGPTANKVVAASGTADYAFNTMHVLTWISGMFCGYRGSTNFTVTVSNPAVKFDDIRVVRVTDGSGPTAANRFIVNSANVLNSASLSTKASRLNEYYNVRDGLAGAAVSSAGVAPTLQFSLPNNLNRNFAFCSWNNYIQGSSDDGTNEEAAMLVITASNTTATDVCAYTTVQTATCAGPDFTFLYFLSTPAVYYLIGDPTPT